MAEKTNSGDLTSALKSLEDTLELYFGKKAPALPKQWKEIIVKLAPYLTILGVILGVPAVLALFGVGTVLAPLGFLGGAIVGRPFLGFNFYLTAIFLVVILVFEALAISGLMKRSMGGWRWLFYASLVNVVQNVVYFNLGGLIIGGALSFYFLFQVKEYYK